MTRTCLVSLLCLSALPAMAEEVFPATLAIITNVFHDVAERAKAMYRAFDQGIETIERLIAEEGIACDFRRAGKLKLASKPAHYDSIGSVTT